MGASFGFGILGSLPIDTSREEQDKALYEILKFNPTYSFYEKIGGDFYRCTLKGDGPSIEPVKGKKIIDLQAFWSMGPGYLSMNVWTYLNSPQLIIGRFKRKTNRVSILGVERSIVNADSLISDIYRLKQHMIQEAKHGWQTDVAQLDLLRDMTSKGHWNQVIVSISG